MGARLLQIPARQSVAKSRFRLPWSPLQSPGVLRSLGDILQTTSSRHRGRTWSTIGVPLLSWTIAVLARRHTMYRAELLGEVRDALEADTVGDLADRPLVLVEQPRGSVEADLPDELHGREAHELFDAAEQGAAALADVGGERVGAVILVGDVIGDRRAHTIEEERALRLELQGDGLVPERRRRRGVRRDRDGR